MKNKKILIVGLGLIGGSYAMGLSNKGYEVYALSLKQKDLDFAKEHGYIIDGRVEVDEDYLSNFKQIIFALYPKAFLSWIKQHGNKLNSGTIISDVTGIKSKIVYEVQSLLPEGVEFIGAHPMAGREVSGVENADCNIFKNANYIITPTDKNSAESIDFAFVIGKDLDFAKISILTPEKHDEMIAFLSQLTHCIAVSLMTCKNSIHLSDYTGDSFRDLTRIANINENMWSELFLMNKEELISQMDLFLSEFKKLKEAIELDNVEQIKDLMRLSTERRSYFNKKG